MKELRNKILFFFLLLFSLVLLFQSKANAGNVSYPTETNILLTSPNITLAVEANSAADLVTVSGVSITVTVSASDSFIIRSDNRYNLVNDSNIAVDCQSGFSKLTINPSSGSQTVIITPTTDTCITSAAPPSCGDVPPGSKASWLYAAVPQDPTSIMLYFTDADGPLDKYVLTYGFSSGKYLFGSTNIGGQGIRTYLVNYLLPGATYYFKVRAGNGCATGPWSNEISAKAKPIVAFNQLDFISSQLEPSKDGEKQQESICSIYSVKSGDTLWSIAAKILGDGSRFKEIAEENKDEYPSLSSSYELEIGWKLKIDCKEDKVTKEEQISGYQLRVKVIDTDNKPVEGSKVTIHSKVQEKITDKDGVAEFNNIELGEHKLIIAYRNYEGEQTVNLTGEIKKFDLNVTIEPKNIAFSTPAIAIIVVLILVIILLSYFFIKSRRKRYP